MHVKSNHRDKKAGQAYTQFVPGANEGELFGEVHTQYVESMHSAASENTENKR